STRDFTDRWSPALAFAGQAAPTEQQVTGQGTTDTDTDAPALVSKLPSHESGPPEEVWSRFFTEHQATDEAVRRAVLRLTRLGEHEHVIHLIQAALIHGQSQPW